MPPRAVVVMVLLSVQFVAFGPGAKGAARTHVPWRRTSPLNKPAKRLRALFKPPRPRLPPHGGNGGKESNGVLSLQTCIAKRGTWDDFASGSR